MVEQSKALSKDVVSRDIQVKFGALPEASEMQKVYALVEKGFDPILHIGIYQGRITVAIDGWWWWGRQDDRFGRIMSKPISKEMKDAYGLEDEEIGVIAELYLKGETEPHCTGFGKASKRPYTYEKGVSPKNHPDRMRNPIDTDNPYRMAEKRAEAQVIRKFRAIGVDVMSPEEATQAMVEGTFTDVVEDSDRFTAPPEQAEQKGHYCTQHQAVFFKRGKMRQYAHPIGDTDQWCNEGGAPVQGSEAKTTGVATPPGPPAKGPPKPDAGAGSLGATPATLSREDVMRWALEKHSKGYTAVCKALEMENIDDYQGTPEEMKQELAQAWQIEL